jgi:hypothetical protein
MMENLIATVEENSQISSNQVRISSGINSTCSCIVDNESLKNYKLPFENYLELKNITKDKALCSRVLLNSIRTKNFDIISTLTSPHKPFDLDYDKLIVLIED